MNWHEKVLDYLYDNFHPAPTSVTEYFKSHILNGHPGDLALARQAKVVLDELESQGLIEWKVAILENVELNSSKAGWNFTGHYKQEFGRTGLAVSTANTVSLSFDTCRVEARLTHIGHMHVSQRRQEALTLAVQTSTLDLNRSTMTLNQQLRSHNWWVLGSTLAILAATAVQATFAVLTYQQSKNPIPIDLRPEIKPEIRVGEIRSDTVHVIYIKPIKPPPAPPKKDEAKKNQ